MSVLFLTTSATKDAVVANDDDSAVVANEALTAREDDTANEALVENDDDKA